MSPARRRVIEKAIDGLEKSLRGKISEDAPFGARTTYRVGGRARAMVEVDCETDLARVAEFCSDSELPLIVLGGGSNMLVADRGFDGVVVTLGRNFSQVHIDGTRVEAGGGVQLPVLARRTATVGLGKFEWAVGIPGTVGGAVRMNAGGHGSDMAAVLVEVHLFDLLSGEHETMSAEDLDLGYRRSALRPHHLVLEAELRLEEEDPAEAKRRIEEIVRWRRENQPGGSNTGAVFVNPADDYAGRLIDRAGCKGLRVGSAQVSTKHANFIVVDPGGRAEDVLHLMREVRRRVADEFGVWLSPETKFAGFDEDELSSVGVAKEN